MPSQIFHSIFAENLIARLNPTFDRRAISPILDSAILLGAQGPDIFFHNRRTKPSGLSIAAALHKKAYGSLSALMLEHCLRIGRNEQSPEGLYLLAFISHAILDRHFHPYINYFSGWVNAENPDSVKYQYCHPFYERILDEACALKFRSEDIGAENTSEEAKGRANSEAEYFPAQALNSLNFAERFGERMYSGIRNMLLRGLRLCFRKMAEDPLLEERVDNAYRDSAGFYWHSEQARESRTIPFRWAALIHPLYLPTDIDFLNTEGREWCDPMDSEIRFNDSVWDIYERAFEEGLAVLSVVYEVLKGGLPPSNYPGLAGALGDHGLRTNIANDTQILVHSDPLPLKQVIQTIALGTFSENWLPWQKVLK